MLNFLTNIKKYLIVIYEKIKEKMTASKTIKFTSIFEKVNSFKFKKLAPAIAGTERKNEILAESYRSKLRNLPAVITIPALLTPGINAST